MKNKKVRWQFRKERVRARVQAHANGRPRLSVHRSLKYIYAQVIDDTQGKTLAFASSLNKEMKAKGSGKNVEAAKAVGQAVAEAAIKAGIKQVAFDRGGNLYCGRIKALADAARAAGLEF